MITINILLFSTIRAIIGEKRLVIEVPAGSTIWDLKLEIGKQYPRLQIWGGLDKRALAHGPEAIDAELERVIPSMRERGRC